MRSLTFEEQMQLNRMAYEQLHDQILQAGPGHFAAIAAGRLVAITNDFDSAVSEIESLSPVPDCPRSQTGLPRRSVKNCTMEMIRKILGILYSHDDGQSKLLIQ